MPRLRELKTNFVSGEMDPLLKQRSDVKAYFNGAEYMRNVVTLPQGGARSRPGTRFMWEVPLIPEIDGGGISAVRMFEFQFSTEQTYLFIFRHKAVSIFREGVLVATVTTPYTSAMLRASLTAGGNLISSGISVTQSRDAMIVFHQDFQPRLIKRGATHADWTISTYAFKNIPIFDFGDVTYTNGVDEIQEAEFPAPGASGNWTDGDTFKLILEDEETDNIRYDADAATLAGYMQAALRKLPNTSATGITVTWVNGGGSGTTGAKFTITFSGEDGDRPWGALGYIVVSAEQVPTIDVFVVTDGERPGEAVWSATRGWPRCGAFFQGRLWAAGTKYLPNTLWATRSGTADDLNNKLIADDYGIQVSSDTDDVPAFIAIYPGRHLQILSTSAEFYVPSSENEAVTPGNISLRRTTSRGAKVGLRVFEIDGATLFVQRRGKALRELIFADVELAYQANNISLLASHLMRDPVGLALRRSSSTEDADYLFMPNSDGTMTVFCTLRTQEVNAMTLWQTEGSFDDVAVALDQVYFSILRTVDGVDRKFIEIMDEEIMVDCAVVGGAGSGATLAHLPETLIEYEVDGFVMPPITSTAGGEITFERPAASSYSAGIKFSEVFPDEYPGLIWCVKTLPPEAQLQDGTTAGRKRRVVNASIRLYETSSLWMNGNEISFRSFGANVLDTPPVSFTGVKHRKGLLGWDYDGQIVLGSKISRKATVLGLSYGVSI